MRRTLKAGRIWVNYGQRTLPVPHQEWSVFVREHREDLVRKYPKSLWAPWGPCGPWALGSIFRLSVFREEPTKELIAFWPKP